MTSTPLRCARVIMHADVRALNVKIQGRIAARVVGNVAAILRVARRRLSACLSRVGAPPGHFAGALARVKATLLASALRGLDPRQPFPLIRPLSERRTKTTSSIPSASRHC